MYSLGGVLRGGWRGGYHSPKVFIKIAGGNRRTDVRQADGALVVRDVLNEIQNTARLTVDGTAPNKGDAIIITLGTINRLDPLFAGNALGVQQIYEGKPANVAWHLDCTDHTWRFNRRQVTKRYMSMSATDIAVDLVETYAPGFSTAGIVDGLESLDEITFTAMELADCFTQIARRIGGYWKIDYRGTGPRVNLWVTSTIQAPVDLAFGSPAATPRFRNLVFTEDISGVITRVYGEGGGANAIQEIALGETIIPVETAEWYNPNGGTFKSGPQIIVYTGRSLGGGGGLVGPGAAPSAAPALALASGSGVNSGTHDYASTFVTASGESLPSPVASITVGAVSAPSAAMAVGSPTSGGSVDAGAHDYQVTFVTSAGETTPSPISTSVTTQEDVGAHYVTPPSTGGSAVQEPAAAGGTSNWNVGDSIYYKVVFVNASGTTTPGPASNTVTPGSDGFGNARLIYVNNIQVSPDPSVTGKRLYRNRNGVWVGYIPLNAGAVGFQDGGSIVAGSPPGSNTAFVAGVDYQTVPLSGIPIGGALVTGRKIYRRFNASGTFKLVDTISNNTATVFTDTVANASLGADAPSTNTAAANQVFISAIPIGAAGVTSRKLYRSVASTAQLKLLATIADNVTSTYTDSIADASLGANAPLTDTSGLAQPEGQVAAGSTTLIVAGLNGFDAAGGWAVTGNGQQIIRYTGVSSTSLTGIPASGVGSIQASIAYNSAVTAAPQLTGIPASGDGALLFPILRGDPINIYVQRDNVAAQATLAALIGDSFDGISEDSIQDRRLSEDEIIARCDALLEKKKDARAEIRYQTKDVTTQSGAEITVNLGDPTNITRTFTIQEVTVQSFEQTKAETDRAYPWYAVVAANDRFSLEDLLRQKRAA